MKVIEVLETQDILDKTFVPLSKVGSKQHYRTLSVFKPV